MSSKYFRTNSSFYDRNDRVRGGFFTSLIPIDYKSEDPAKEDRDNRTEVVNRIAEYIKQDKMTLEDACEKLSEDADVIEKFKYLERENLAQIFANWYKGRMKGKRPIEKGGK